MKLFVNLALIGVVSVSAITVVQKTTPTNATAPALVQSAAIPLNATAAPALAQSTLQGPRKNDGHIHEPDIRVDPPLTEEGKKFIAQAEKDLDDVKKLYDEKKRKLVEAELAFHAAARLSKAAREDKAKAEDRAFLSGKSASKASKYAENIEKEAKKAYAT